jgi:hypothetical protein
VDWTNEQVEALRWAFNAAGIDLDNVVEAIKKICEAMVICYTELEEAMARVALIVQENAAQVASEAEELAALAEKAERLDIRAKREQKERRARRCAFERANAARFSQRKVRELSWKQQRRKRPHWREWRGADRT